MDAWKKYTTTKSKNVALGGDNPNVLEYLCINVVDNGMIVTFVFIFILSSVVALILKCKGIEASFFEDISKLFAGALIGVFVGKRGKKNE